MNRAQKHININRVASVYGKEHIGNFVKTQINDGNLKYIDKNKSQAWSIRRGLQLPKLNTILNSDNSILQKENIVNRYSAQKTNKYAEDISDNTDAERWTSNRTEVKSDKTVIDKAKAKADKVKKSDNVRLNDIVSAIRS